MAAPMRSKSDDTHGKSECAVCDKKKRIMKQCTRCRRIVYCSRECQLQDWSEHKIVCSGKESRNSSTDMNTNAGENSNSESCSTSSQLLPQKIEDVSITDSMQMSQQSSKQEVQEDLQQGPSSNQKQTVEFSNANQGAPCKIIVKCQRDKHSISINLEWEATQMLSHICEKIKIPAGMLKLVHKGKLVNEGNVKACIKERAVFQAIGEVAESEEGLDPSHIDRVVSKLGANRNDAIRALRLKGDVTDAILYLANK